MAPTSNSSLLATLEGTTVLMPNQLASESENNDGHSVNPDAGSVLGNSSDVSSFNEQHLVCGCGNPGHVDLEEWDKLGRNTNTYFSDDLTKDTLDMEVISQEINNLKSRVQIADGFCQNCLSFINILPDFLSKDQSEKDKDEHNTEVLLKHSHFQCVAEFQASYQRECRLCVLLEQCHQQKRWSTMSIESFYKIEARRRCLGKPTAIHMMVVKGGPRCSLFLNLPGEEIDWGFHILGSLIAIPLDTPDLSLSDRTKLIAPEGLEPLQFEVAYRWIATCFESHPCCAEKSNCHLPTRLLEIKEDSVRLILTENLETKPKYATLSHCWGSLDFLKLTTDSLSSMMVSIQTEKLTKTFRDAISFVRSIGIEYIWIDSLCIIQDSKADWEIESASMASVYRGSAITIAATGATDGTMGCFLKPQEYIGHIRVEKSDKKAWNIAQICESISMLPLGRRAWSLQERLLPPRVLHFAPNEIRWECKFGHASEYSPSIVKREHAETLFSSRWGKIVNDYTDAQLTYESDKLVAIAGIALAVNEETGDEYLAGLWKKDIEEQLLWIKAGVNNLGRPASSEPYRAPSWSWASIVGKVFYAQPESRFASWAHVLSSSLTYAGTDPYVQVTKGTLELCTKAILPGILQETYFHQYRSCQIVDLDGSIILNRFEGFSDSLGENDRAVFLLPMFDSGTPDPDQELGGRCFKGLILGRGTTKGEFHRVGKWTLRDTRHSRRENGVWKKTESRTEYDIRLKIFVELLQGVGVETAKSECAKILDEPKYPDERYVINLV